MKKASLTILVLWIFFILPGMILGFLWSGEMPIWPPGIVGMTIDFIAWIVLFIIGYIVPFIMISILLISYIIQKAR